MSIFTSIGYIREFWEIFEIENSLKNEFFKCQITDFEIPAYIPKNEI